MAAEAPQIVADTRSRSAPDLLATVVRSVEVVAHHKATGLGDTALVFSPEHVAHAGRRRLVEEPGAGVPVDAAAEAGA